MRGHPLKEILILNLNFLEVVSLLGCLFFLISEVVLLPFTQSAVSFGETKPPIITLVLIHGEENDLEWLTFLWIEELEDWVDLLVELRLGSVLISGHHGVMLLELLHKHGYVVG